MSRSSNILNLDIGDFFGVGRYDVPTIKAIRAEEIAGIKKYIGFNYCLSNRTPSQDTAVHFFLDDYQFERIWNNPSAYVEKLRKYGAVISPDFSVYSDMPLALKIYNHYRKQWIGAYLQKQGVKVIPCVRASTDERSLGFFLDGIPHGGVVCISSMWTSKPDAKKYFIEKEFKIMNQKLEPEKILMYGKIPDELKGIKNIERIPTFCERFKNGKRD